MILVVASTHRDQLFSYILCLVVFACGALKVVSIRYQIAYLAEIGLVLDIQYGHRNVRVLIIEKVECGTGVRAVEVQLSWWRE